jgi:hypothetical protein
MGEEVDAADDDLLGIMLSGEESMRVASGRDVTCLDQPPVFPMFLDFHFQSFAMTLPDEAGFIAQS